MCIFTVNVSDLFYIQKVVQCRVCEINARNCFRLQSGIGLVYLKL